MGGAVREVTPTYRCEVCGKVTSRLLGFFAVVSTVNSAENGSQRTSARSWVAAVCLRHREEISQRFEAEVAAAGHVEFMGTPPAELRPADVAGFRASVD